MNCGLWTVNWELNVEYGMFGCENSCQKIAFCWLVPIFTCFYGRFSPFDPWSISQRQMRVWEYLTDPKSTNPIITCQYWNTSHTVMKTEIATVVESDEVNKYGWWLLKIIKPSPTSHMYYAVCNMQYSSYVITQIKFIQFTVHSYIGK